MKFYCFQNTDGAVAIIVHHEWKLKVDLTLWSVYLCILSMRCFQIPSRGRTWSVVADE